MKAINSHVGAWSPMAEQNATAKFLMQSDAIDKYLVHFKKELEERLRLIHQGFQQLKEEGFTVDSIEPQAAIYLTIQIDLIGKETAEEKILERQKDVTEYILNEAKLAVVPFYAFGASKNSNWYRLSVGTCKKDEISEMLAKLKQSLEKLR
jgi:aspartate aminotransferase